MNKSKQWLCELSGKKLITTVYFSIKAMILALICTLRFPNNVTQSGLAYLEGWCFCSVSLFGLAHIPSVSVLSKEGGGGVLTFSRPAWGEERKGGQELVELEPL